MTTVSTVMDSTDSGQYGGNALAPRVGPLEGFRQTFSPAWCTLVQISRTRSS